jgi:hypothetical protein
MFVKAPEFQLIELSTGCGGLAPSIGLVGEFAQFGWKKREKWECSPGSAVQNWYKIFGGSVSS